MSDASRKEASALDGVPGPRDAAPEDDETNDDELASRQLVVELERLARPAKVGVAAPGFGEPCTGLSACGRNLRCVDGVCDVGVAKVCGLRAPW